MMTPQTVLADGDSVRFSFKGPNLASAKVQFFVGDKEFPVTKRTDFEVNTVVPRDTFPFDSSEDAIFPVTVKFYASPGVFVDTGWQSRSFDVWLLPQVLGTAAIVETIQRPAKLPSHFDTVAQATGKDVHMPVGISIFPHLLSEGWKIDTAQIAAVGALQVIGAAGEKGSCNGVSLSNMTETAIVYNIHIGSTRKGLGRSRGGWQHCHIRVPIYKMTDTPERKLSEPLHLSWTKDKTFKLSDRNSKSEVRVELFNDRVYENVEASTSMTYLRFSRNGDTLLFSPRPPVDF